METAIEIKRKMDHTVSNFNMNSADMKWVTELVGPSKSYPHQKQRLQKRLQDFFEYSFYLQRAQQYHLGERIYATSDMNSITYILNKSQWDLVVFDVDETLITSLDSFL